jgi:hypothetical protein
MPLPTHNQHAAGADVDEPCWPRHTLTLTRDDVDDLVDGASINVPCGPGEQETILRGSELSESEIRTLRRGGSVEHDGWALTTENQPSLARSA